MNIRIYGTGGMPVIAFPPQGSKADAYESFGLIDVLAKAIRADQVQLFCVDSVDDLSWNAADKPADVRMLWQERYYRYIVEQVVPFVSGVNPENARPYVFGVSLGATQAAIAFFRRPDLFQGVLSLSPALDPHLFFGDWSDDLLYQNTPLYFLDRMPTDHEYIALYQQRNIIFCAGQGTWDRPCADSMRRLQPLLERLHVPAWFDYWGTDADHDWYWWKKQVVYFLPHLLKD